MSSGRDIEKLDDFSGGKFDVWLRRVMGHWSQYNASVYEALTVETATEAEIIQMPRAEQLVVRAALDASSNERARLDDVAGTEILRFLGPALAQQHRRTISGKQMLADLRQEFAEWQLLQAPILQQQLRDFGPRDSEGVIAYCTRAADLAMELREVGRPQQEAFMVDTVLNALSRERPIWGPALLGLRGSMARDADVTLRQLRPLLADIESRDPGLKPAAAQAHAAQAAKAREDPRDARIAALEAQAYAAQATQVRGTPADPRDARIAALEARV